MRQIRVLAIIGVVWLGAVLASAVVYADKPDEEGHHHNDDPGGVDIIEASNFMFDPPIFGGEDYYPETTVDVHIVQASWHNVSVCKLGTAVNGVCADTDVIFNKDFERNKQPISIDFSEGRFEGGTFFNYFCKFHIDRDMLGTIQLTP